MMTEKEVMKVELCSLSAQSEVCVKLKKGKKEKKAVGGFSQTTSRLLFSRTPFKMLTYFP